MAKKKTAEEAASEAAAPAAEAAAPVAEEKKPRKSKPKPAPEAAAPEKTSPEAPSAAPSAPAPEVAVPDEGKPTKKKGKRPGVPPTRGKKLKNHLKNLQQKLGKSAALPVIQAIKLLKENKRAKFDETVEVHMCLGIDTKQSDQMVRGSVPLPHGIGKSVRLLVFTQGENAVKAQSAGADHVGGDDLAKKIQGGWLDFDVALATPDMMGIVGRLGKILGPRGLMPTPKAGTVITGDVATAVREFKAGKVEYRADAGGNVHAPVGKMSFEPERLVGNITAFIDQIKAAKPAAAKGNYIKSITVSATMSPGIRVNA